MKTNSTNVLKVTSIYQKVEAIEQQCQQLLHSESQFEIPAFPARDIMVSACREKSTKPRLSSSEGQARLLHDLASIELQAMELGVRTLIEFPNAPTAFREELSQITIEESQHLKLCLQGLEKTPHQWGDFPCHLHLWEAVSSEDDLIDRILIVHRYLEGSGLDASDMILRKLSGLGDHKYLTEIVNVIRRDEISHVEFGSRWFREICRQKKLDPDFEFKKRLTNLKTQIPKRNANLVYELRRQAGFNDSELDSLKTIFN